MVNRLLFFLTVWCELARSEIFGRRRDIRFESAHGGGGGPRVRPQRGHERRPAVSPRRAWEGWRPGPESNRRTGLCSPSRAISRNVPSGENRHRIKGVRADSGAQGEGRVSRTFQKHPCMITQELHLSPAASEGDHHFNTRPLCNMFYIHTMASRIHRIGGTPHDTPASGARL